jgi:hypothetical protein
VVPGNAGKPASASLPRPVVEPKPAVVEPKPAVEPKSIPPTGKAGTPPAAAGNPASASSKSPTAASPSAPAAPAPDQAAEAAAKAAVDVDNALCRIRASDPPELPQAVPETMTPDEERVEWSITNPNSAKLTIYLRGPEKRKIVVEPGKTEKILFAPGKYEVAAELAVDNVTPFYGTQDFAKSTRYKSRFRVEF